MHDAYQSFREGSLRLARDDAHAAAILFERARDLEPDQASIREGLARAYYRTGRFTQARAEFERAIEIDPVNDYAYFGLGLCALRLAEHDVALRNLRLAVAMRPQSNDYRDALREAEARHIVEPTTPATEVAPPEAPSR